MNQFKVFISMANKKNIKIIFGISPGLGFTHSTDINLLINKIESIQSIGIEHVAILFDDLFQNSSGVTHAEIVNQCVDEFKTISLSKTFNSSAIGDQLYRAKPLSLKGFSK